MRKLGSFITTYCVTARCSQGRITALRSSAFTAPRRRTCNHDGSDIPCREARARHEAAHGRSDSARPRTITAAAAARRSSGSCRSRRQRHRRLGRRRHSHRPGLCQARARGPAGRCTGPAHSHTHHQQGLPAAAAAGLEGGGGPGQERPGHPGTHHHSGGEHGAGPGQGLGVRRRHGGGDAQPQAADQREGGERGGGAAARGGGRAAGEDARRRARDEQDVLLRGLRQAVQDGRRVCQPPVLLRPPPQKAPRGPAEGRPRAQGQRLRPRQGQEEGVGGDAAALSGSSSSSSSGSTCATRSGSGGGGSTWRSAAAAAAACRRGRRRGRATGRAGGAHGHQVLVRRAEEEEEVREVVGPPARC